VVVVVVCGEMTWQGSIIGTVVVVDHRCVGRDVDMVVVVRSFPGCHVVTGVGFSVTYL